ncbi:hypothetical protein MKX03_005366 [Papaver bracteatum]|nr:hypothetical protein MKX03_005366 [Papaver bracteatum]
MMINLRLVSQEHSQLPPKSFRLSPGLRANAALFLPWMSETSLQTLLVSMETIFTSHLNGGIDKICTASF